MKRTAHRKALRAKVLNRKFVFVKYIYLLFGIFLLSFLVMFLKGGGVWNGQDKVVLAIGGAENKEILVLDPSLGEVTRMKLSGDLEVTLANNFGVMRLKNVWDFGKNEGRAGEIFAKTLSKNFFIPVYLYSSQSPDSFIKFVTSQNDSNLRFIDRLKIYLFYKNVKDINVTKIDLEKSQFIKKEKLSDGEFGYKIYENLFERLYVYFNDDYVSKVQARVHIIDAGGNYGVANGVGKTLETMGGKIVGIDRVELSQGDCLVAGQDKVLVNKMVNLFGCKMDKSIIENNVDITMSLGSSFAKRY